MDNTHTSDTEPDTKKLDTIRKRRMVPIPKGWGRSRTVPWLDRCVVVVE
jgi:hypothetical protein